MKFLCDHMLGTLARWLRILGFDTLYPGPLEDERLKTMASEEERILLTRDKDLSKSNDVDVLYVSSDVLDEQIEQVIRAFNLKIEDPMSRCSLCNVPIVSVSKERARGNVPDGIYERHKEFWQCPHCGKYYWQGSHWDRMRRKIKKYQSM